MDTFEKLIKSVILFVFCLLNAIDMVQTAAFLRMGIEGNIFVLYHPQLWFVLKFAFTFGLPYGLYYLDAYVQAKEDEGFYAHLSRFIDVMYVTMIFADIFYLQLVMKNAKILGRILP